MPTSVSVRLASVAVLLGGLVCLAGSPLGAQQLERGRTDGVVTGMVVDAGTGTPLSGALVVLEAAGDGTVVQPSASGGFVQRGMTAVTGPDGVYRLAGLPPGPYRLLVRLLGYRESRLDLDLSPSTYRVSVGLVMNPIMLEPIDVEMPVHAFGRTRTTLDEARFGRIGAEALRQQRFLETDARLLTHSDVTEAVTLEEHDLLRALQRLPGVSARDDYTAGLWTRGAPWGQTRAYYDGMPLFNPVHAFGLLSSLSPDAVGVASFHPGVRSAAIGEGAAGVLSLTSRGADRPGVHGLGEVSVTSARAALEARSAAGGSGVVVSARRSYIDLATNLAHLAGGDSAVYVPYAFLDLTLRGDLMLGARTGLEISGLWTEDNIRGDVRRLLQRTRGVWGNRVAQATVQHGGPGLRSRTTIGISRFHGLINPPAPEGRGNLYSPDFAAEDPDGEREVPQHGSTRNYLIVSSLSTELSQSSGTRRSPWAAGVQLLHYQQSFGGQLPRPYPVRVLPDTLVMDDAMLLPALWGEHRWIALPSLAIETGLRLEFPAATRNAPVAAVSPRVTTRFTLPGGVATLSAGAGRSWQYTQALAPAGPSVGPDLYLTDVWLLASDTIPAIRSDVATIGTEISLGDAWIAGATGYVRRATGVAVPDPQPGLLNSQRPVFVPAVNDAAGIELGIRRIVGRLTASVSYTLAKSVLSARGYTFPSPADRRHALDATAMFRATPGLRLGAAFTAGTGTPFSRVILGAACDTLGQCSADTIAVSIEAPNGERTSPYAALDLLLDWEGSMGRARVGAFLQVRNVLNVSNAVTYTGSIQNCTGDPPRYVHARPGTCDRFDRGIPLLPLAGVRIAF